MTMRIVKTIRGQITALYVTIFGITLVAFSSIIYILYERKSWNEFDLSLSNRTLEIVDAIKDTGILEEEILAQLTQTVIPLNFGGSEYIEIYGIDGRPIVKSRSLQGYTLPVDRRAFTFALLGKQTYQTISTTNPKARFWGKGDLRLLTYPVLRGGITEYVIVLGRSTETLVRSLFFFRLMLFVAIPLTLLIASMGGWYIAKKAFDPIDSIVRTARAITAEHLHMRLPTRRVGDEIDQLSQTLNEMIDRLEQAFQTEKRFSGDVSHELRTPLTILKGEMEVALQQQRSPEEYREVLRSAIDELGRITKIVNDLLLLSRTDAGYEVLQHELIRMDELIMDAVHRANVQARAKDIDITVRISNDVEDEEIVVNGDPDKLMSLFSNLLENAIKYSPPRSPVVVHLSRLNGYAEIIIEDHGIGISQEDLPHIFDRFYRADKSRTSDTQATGTGLGLSIAKWVAEAHGGSITAQSELGKGTRMVVRLPVAHADQAHDNI